MVLVCVLAAYLYVHRIFCTPSLLEFDLDERNRPPHTRTSRHTPFTLNRHTKAYRYLFDFLQYSGYGSITMRRWCLLLLLYSHLNSLNRIYTYVWCDPINFHILLFQAPRTLQILPPANCLLVFYTHKYWKTVGPEIPDKTEAGNILHNTIWIKNMDRCGGKRLRKYCR